MYLKKFIIKNFRAIKSLTLDFNKGVNVLIGENNSGKSSIIDALRICLGYGNQLREIGTKVTDFYIDKQKSSVDYPDIEFHLYFKMNDDKHEARYFYEMIHQDNDDISSQEIQLHFRYYIEKKDDKEIVRWKVWGGTNEGQPVNYDSLRFIDYTFLDALRDATQKLRPYSQQNKLAQLFENLVTYENKDGNKTPLNNEKKKELASKLETWLKDKDNEWKYLIQEGETNVNEHLRKSEIEDEQIPIDIAFSGYDYKDVVNNLQLRIPIFSEAELDEKKQKYFTLNQNGLGQNNLIYAATILGDLLNKKNKGHYHALLIEEPEAHLHPQKQNTFFEYLNDLEKEDIQIFITSHSPTITAKTDLEFVTVLQKRKDEIGSLALKNSSLTPENRKYLRKFLDVTKSQLFFAKGVILVEGISEALLLPIFSKIIGYNLEKHGIEIINVGGTAFEHFAKLFNESDEKKSMFSKCSLISDDDKGLIQKDDFISSDFEIDKTEAKEIFKKLKENELISEHNRVLSENISGIDIKEEAITYVAEVLRYYKDEISNRAKNISKMNSNNLMVKLAEYTFEYELMMASDFNLRIFKFLYKKMHPKTEFYNHENRKLLRLEILEKIESNKDKSELAHRMAMMLESIYSPKNNYPIRGLVTQFKVPSYIEEAIKWVVNGSQN
jgi:putative ATP-dependent endonuclease of OLD family